MFKFHQNNKVVLVKETSELPPCIACDFIEEDSGHFVSDYIATTGKGYVLSDSGEALDVKKQNVRSVRNSYLKETDIFMLNDYPVNDEQREKYKSYRAYLRAIPESPDFPDIEVKTFAKWQQ